MTRQDARPSPQGTHLQDSRGPRALRDTPHARGPAPRGLQSHPRLGGAWGPTPQTPLHTGPVTTGRSQASPGRSGVLHRMTCNNATVTISHSHDTGRGTGHQVTCPEPAYQAEAGWGPRAGLDLSPGRGGLRTRISACVRPSARSPAETPRNLANEKPPQEDNPEAANSLRE